MPQSNNQTKFHEELKELIDEYIHLIYDETLHFPSNEQFGVTSQLRRAALSIMLNYVEGYARIHRKVMRNFLEISYGSLKESRYLLYFSYKRKYINKVKLHILEPKADRIGKMLWGIVEKL